MLDGILITVSSSVSDDVLIVNVPKKSIPEFIIAHWFELNALHSSELAF